MHDLVSVSPTNQDPVKPLRLTLDLDKPVDPATKNSILNTIMETGVPCQEKVSGEGPEGPKKNSTGT
jgi:hypothetical protein